MFRLVFVAAIFFAAVVGAFGYGVAMVRFELPPHQQVKQLFRYIKPDVAPYLAEFTLSTAEISKGLELTRDNAAAVRTELMDRVIIPEDQVKISIAGTPDRESEILASFYGIETKAVLNKAPGEASRCLQIYIQGHGGDPFEFDYHNEILTRTNDKGCDMLSMSMFGIGLNLARMTFPTGKYPSQSSTLTADRHGNISLYFDNDLPQVDQLGLMLTPHYYTILSIIDDYEEVSMMGISGGGWYTVWLAALIEEIDTSIVYAGSLPMVYRSTRFFFGDHEEYASEIYRAVDYWELYMLGSHRENGAQDRQYYMVFNDADPCCFMDPAASHFKDVAAEIYGDNFNVLIDAHDKHAMKVSVIEDIWREVGFGR